MRTLDAIDEDGVGRLFLNSGRRPADI